MLLCRIILARSLKIQKTTEKSMKRAEPVFEATEDFLKDIGAVKRIGSKKNGYWEVIG
jgi:hypothetical protein